MECVTSSFVKAVSEPFHFLIRQYEFMRTYQAEKLVIYESDKVFVKIGHDWKSFELSLSIGLLSSQVKTGFGFEYVIQLSDSEQAKRFRYPIAFNDAQIKEGLLELATLLRQYGDAVLRGDPKAFERMLAFSEAYWAKDPAERHRESEDSWADYGARYEKKLQEAKNAEQKTSNDKQ